MKNILGTTENLILEDQYGIVRYKFYEDSTGYWYKQTYDKKGNQLTYENSDGHYRIKGEKVTKEQFENFVNGTKEVKDLLLETAKPLIEYLNNNYHPHCKIIVQCDSVEVLEGVESSITKEFIKD